MLCYAVGRKDTTAESNLCTACNDTENILHLATCNIIRLEFWDIILGVLVRMGLAPPEDDTAFLVLGRINADSVIDTHLAGVRKIQTWAQLWNGQERCASQD